MEKFKFVIPTIEWKKKAIDFINEFYKYNSNINSTGRLQRYLDNYEGWLEKLEEDYTRQPSEEKVPARTYFFVRESDNKIIGMLNLRLVLNEKLKNDSGNIGYSIRPTERGNGYNKINLYLGLKVCKEYGIEEVFMDADKDNPASWKTIESLGGKNIREYFEDEFDHCIVKDYIINVKTAIDSNKDKYEPYIINIF